MHMRLCIPLLSVLAVVAPAAAAAQQRPATLVAVITADGGRPLAGATATVAGTSLRAVADTAGKLVIQGIAPGVHVVEVEMLGYATERSTIAFASGTTVEKTIALVPGPIRVRGVEVDAETVDRGLAATGFMARSKGGWGTFLYGKELRARADAGEQLSDALRGMRGIRVVPSLLGYTLESTRGPASINMRCAPRLLLDDLDQPTGDIDSVVSLEDVAGIEVYAGPSDTPPQFGGVMGGAACGVVVIWTRHGP